MSALRVPVLTYHSYRIDGHGYAENDHEALRADLRAIARAGMRIVPLTWVAEWVLGRRAAESLERAVAITFDDGADFDFHDLEHPTCGPQRSFLNLLRDWQEESGAAVHATSFVIASPLVRTELDARCLIGRGWMSDDWWGEAERSGLLAIQSHSWDHNHPMASHVCQRDQRRGSFAWIETHEECVAEVEQAARYIAELIDPGWPELFAYPEGVSSAYLRDVYLPGEVARHRTIAAFGAGGGHVVQDSPRWDLPRFVCGAHWTDPAGLERILREAR